MSHLSLWTARASTVAAILGAASLAGLGAAGPEAPAGAVSQAPEGGGLTASADVRNAEGESLGTASFAETPHGVLVTVALSNLAPGEHALHLHETGQCEGPDFTSAGGHYNPDAKSHGFRNPAGAHAGDMPNVHVDSEGELNVELFVPGVTLAAGPKSLLDDDGTAIVVHEGTDDYRSDPAGDAGGRMACGVVEPD